MDRAHLVQLTKDVYRLTLLFPKREPLRWKIREAGNDLLAGFIAQRNNNAATVRECAEIIVSFLEVALDQDWVSPASILEVKKVYDTMIQPPAAAEAVTPQREGQIEIATENVKSERLIIYAPAAAARPLIENRAGMADKKTVTVKTSVLQEQSVAAENSVTDEGEEGHNQPKQDQGTLSEGQIIRQNRIAEYLKEMGQAQVWEIQKIFPLVSKRTIRRDFRSMVKQGIIVRIGERNKTYYKLKVNTI